MFETIFTKSHISPLNPVHNLMLHPSKFYFAIIRVSTFSPKWPHHLRYNNFATVLLVPPSALPTSIMLYGSIFLTLRKENKLRRPSIRNFLCYPTTYSLIP